MDFPLLSSCMAGESFHDLLCRARCYVVHVCSKSAEPGRTKLDDHTVKKPNSDWWRCHLCIPRKLVTFVEIVRTREIQDR